jgi:hypothetical protein
VLHIIDVRKVMCASGVGGRNPAPPPVGQDRLLADSPSVRRRWRLRQCCEGAALPAPWRAQELIDVLQSMFASETANAAAKRNVSPVYQEQSVQSASSTPQSSMSYGLSGVTGSIGTSSGGFGGGGGTSVWPI